MQSFRESYSKNRIIIIQYPATFVVSESIFLASAMAQTSCKQMSREMILSSVLSFRY